MYSKDRAFDAQENFTTEAVAIAVAGDPGPIVRALLQLNPVKAEALSLSSSAIHPRTQVALSGCGWLDLVLDVRDEQGRLEAEVWIEVKIQAPETGQQLDAYAAAATTRGHPVWIFTLAPAPVRDGFENLNWNVLYQSAKKHEIWNDLRAFLKEQKVASDALGPVSDQEAGSLEASYELIQKASEVIRAVHQSFGIHFSAPWARKLRWAAEGSLLNFVGANFRDSGEMAGVGGPLAYGLASDEGSAYWFIAVRQGSATRSTPEVVRATAERSGDARLAANTGLDAGWQRPNSGSTVAEIRIRATALGSHATIVHWFEQRLVELASSGVIETLLGPLPINEAGAGPDQGSSIATPNANEA